MPLVEIQADGWPCPGISGAPRPLFLPPQRTAMISYPTRSSAGNRVPFRILAVSCEYDCQRRIQIISALRAEGVE